MARRAQVAAFVFAALALPASLFAVTATTMSVTASPTSGPTAAGITWTIKVAPASGTALVTSGSGTWQLVNSAGQDQVGVNAYTLNTVNNGTFTISISGFKPDTYTLRVTYAGNTTWGSSSGSASGTTYADSAVTITSATEPSDYGSSVTFTAAVGLKYTLAGFSATPTGTITWKNGTTTLGTSTMSAGKATFTTSSLATGAQTITAVYSGDSQFWTSTGTFTEHVRAPTVLTVTVSPTQVAAKGGWTYTISVKPSSGSGTVSSGSGTWQIVNSQGVDQVGVNPYSLNTANNGTFTVSLSGFNPENYTLKATYAGDTQTWMASNSASATASDGTPTTTTVTSSSSTSTYGTSVTFTATVTASGGTPTGTVKFYDSSTYLGSGTLSNGKATLSISSLTAGNHVITANYLADSTYGVSTSNGLTQRVNQATPSVAVTSSVQPAVYRQAVTFTANVTGTATTPTGSVEFYVDSALAGTFTLSSGKATYSTSTLTTGSHTVAVKYTGDTNYRAANSSNATETVNAANTTTTLSAPAAIVSGASATLTATVAAVSPSTGTPTGTVTFFDGSTQLGSAVTLNASSVATLTTTLSDGLHSLTAKYSGATGFNASTSAASSLDAVVGSVTSLTISPIPADPGQTVTLAANVQSSGAAPTGTITFADGGVTIGSPVSLDTSGNATMTTTSFASGTHNLTATYSGDTNVAASASGAVSLVVRSSSTTTLTSSLNPSLFAAAVTLTATVPAASTGTVTFFDGSTALDSATVSSGSAALTIATLPVGSHSITASYGGDGNYLASTSAALAQVVDLAPTTITLASDANPSTYAQSVTFTATVTAGATGTVTFSDGGSVVAAAPVNSGLATFTTSTLTAGSHALVATYSGDTSYAGSTSSTLTQTVNQSTTAISLTQSANPSAYGSAVDFTANVTDGATGTVTFMDGSTTLGTAPLTGTAATATFTTSSLSVGAHSITAIYGGDSNHTGSTSSAVPQTVNRASTTTALSSSANPSVYGGAVTFTANVTAGATGSVTFDDGASVLATVALSSGTATYTTSALAGGSHSIAATYGGDSNYVSSTSPVLAQSVNAAASTVTVSASADPTTYGTAVTFTATVTTGATGTVTFNDGATALGTVALTGNTAAFTTSSLTAGAHSITAAYGGDANYAASTSAALGQTVNPAASTTVLTSSLNPSTYGSAVTFTATVTSGATGTVTFADGGTTLAAVTISGNSAAYTTTGLTAGAHSITATYGGDANYAPSAPASITQTVTAASSTLTLASSTNPSVYGTSVTFTATLPAGATGTVTFNDGASSLGSAAVSGGTAGLAMATLAAGSHSIAAVYSGDANYAGATSTVLTQTVSAATTATTIASSLNPSTFGSSITFTATVTPAASGSVTFNDGSTALATVPLSGGTAAFTTAALLPGAHSIIAVYGGDANYATSTSSALLETVNVAGSSTTLRSSANPSVFGNSVTFTATVPAGATGSVAFSDGATTLGTAPVSSGSAAFSTSSLSAGMHSITATYSGDSTHAASTSAALMQSVTAAPTTMTLASSANPSVYGSPVTFTATVPAGATGTIAFSDGGTALATTAIVANTATVATASLSAGPHSITAVYAGDANHAGSSAALTQTVDALSTTTALASSLNPATAGASVTFTATVTNGATGSVTFDDGTTALATIPLTGNTAAYTTSSLAAGTHSITAGYGGDGNHKPSTSAALAETVQPPNGLAPTTTTLASSLNPSTPGTAVTFTATVTNGATGTVAFSDAGAPLATVPLIGNNATLTTSALTAGTHTITAVYTGDATFAASSSAALTQTVAASSGHATSSTAVVSSANPSVYGGSVTFTATVTPAATGSMTFTDGAITLGTVVLAGSSATFTTSSLTAGTHSIVAVYGGDATVAPSSSPALQQSVGRAPSSIAIASSANPVTFGTSATFTATITPGATGTVEFHDGAAAIGTATISGTASFSTAALTVGTHSVTASYGGDTNYSSATSPAVSEVVTAIATTIALASSPDPSAAGQAVTFTATVAPPVPGAGVGFYDGSTLLGTATITASGSAAFSTSTLSTGLHTIKAVFAGDATHVASTSGPLSQRITAMATTTTLATSPNPALPGMPVTLTATVSPIGGGTVSFYDGPTALGTVPLDALGRAALTTGALSLAAHSITAVYSGDAAHAPSTSAAVVELIVATIPQFDPRILAALAIVLGAIALWRTRV